MHGAVSIRSQDPYSAFSNRSRISGLGSVRIVFPADMIPTRAARQRGIPASSNSYFHDGRSQTQMHSSRYSPKEFRVPHCFSASPGGECLDGRSANRSTSESLFFAEVAISSGAVCGHKKSPSTPSQLKDLPRSSCSMGLQRVFEPRRRKARFRNHNPTAGVLALARWPCHLKGVFKGSVLAP